MTSTRGSRSLAGKRMVAERYEVLEELARGGMGVVLKVRDQLKDGELCALKLMVADKARPTALKRFRREVEALTAVRHPSIVRVRDFGTEGGLPFYAMDYVPGEDLEVLTRERFRFADEGVGRELRRVAVALADGGEALTLYVETEAVERFLRRHRVTPPARLRRGGSA